MLSNLYELDIWCK